MDAIQNYLIVNWVTSLIVELLNWLLDSWCELGWVLALEFQLLFSFLFECLFWCHSMRSSTHKQFFCNVQLVSLEYLLNCCVNLVSPFTDITCSRNLLSFFRKIQTENSTTFCSSPGNLKTWLIFGKWGASFTPRL